jgi:hypothetical protein
MTTARLHAMGHRLEINGNAVRRAEAPNRNRCSCVIRDGRRR